MAVNLPKWQVRMLVGANNHFGSKACDLIWSGAGGRFVGGFDGLSRAIAEGGRWSPEVLGYILHYWTAVSVPLGWIYPMPPPTDCSD